ncbi:MAG TPA: type IV secretion system DNA-binding domain-containing protein [Candidatus Saccharimonadales bacterium]|nr:type IV secretion system DNA-binding domain-containing protein [Candidatus Saccharimonadales bacterium]
MDPNLTPPPASSTASSDGVVLLLQVPRTNEKKELAAEQMFASLHGLLTMPSQNRFKTPLRERLSFEIAVLKKRIGFYIWVPEYLKNFVEEQIYAQYPTVQISEVQDYSMKPDAAHPTTLVTEMKLVANDALPIKTFQSFEVDPLAAITAALAKFEDNEEAWIQLVLRPAPANWHKKSERYIAGLRGGGGGGSTMSGLLGALWAPPEHKAGEATKLTEYESARAGGAEEKSHKLAFETVLRIVYRGDMPPAQAKLHLQSIIASYKQFNTTYMNGFEQRKTVENPTELAYYRARDCNRSTSILNIEEVATLYHLPHTNVETPYILWALSQTAEPPANLPIVAAGTYREDVSPVAVTNFRGHNTMFGLPRSDRGRHLYIIGQTGVGKSGMLELLTISDIYTPYGFAVIDPHGDYAMSVLRRIPPERANDVIYFNPADTDFPIAFNPMEVHDPKLRTHTASELIGVLKRMFESWGPRLEYILRYSLLALLDYPDATMLDITRILTDRKFRQEVLQYVNDPVVRNFWEIEFASWNDKFAAEAVAPVLNKVGAFTANPLVRNIIGQPKSSFNLRQIMDERKILIVNLSRGLVGEDNAALLGALLVTKIQLGAMSRADVSASERHPFYLYVDEFQNFATDSFATILSEARKYGLNLTVANQYIAQMPMEVKDAVFGNVGSIVAFRMGADDARVMQRYFEPKFLEYDLVHMHNRHFVISMTIEGEKVPAFSGVSINLPPQQADHTEAIVERCRRQYATNRDFVDRYIGERYLLQAPAAAAPSPKSKRVTGPTNSKPATPKPAAANKPAPTPAKSEEPAAVASSVGHTAVAGPVAETAKPVRGADDAPKKRKRTRRRKKPATSSSPSVASDDNTLKVHH